MNTGGRLWKKGRVCKCVSARSQKCERKRARVLTRTKTERKYLRVHEFVYFNVCVKRERERRREREAWLRK